MFAVFSISVFTLAVVTLAMLPLHVTVAVVLACRKIFSNDDSVSLSVSGLSDLLTYSMMIRHSSVLHAVDKAMVTSRNVPSVNTFSL